MRLIMRDAIVFLAIIIGYFVFSKILLDSFEEAIYDISKVKTTFNRVAYRILLLIFPIFILLFLLFYTLYCIFVEILRPGFFNAIKNIVKYLYR